MEGGLNTYGYVEGNPLRWIDPLGLLILPDDPGKLPSDWQRDYTHRDPNGERYRHPSGDHLDFHRGRPGEKGWKGKDHWHHNDGDKHYKPGDEVPDPVNPQQCKDKDKPPKIPWGRILLRYPLLLCPACDFALPPPYPGIPDEV